MNNLETLNLGRLPKDHDKSLRAWDSADQLLLEKAESLQLQTTDMLWVFNDGFGALSCGLGDSKHQSFSDSATTVEATAKNRSANALVPKPVLAITELNDEQLPADVKAVLLKLPKNHGYFEQQLGLLNQLLPDATPVIIAGMQKYFNQSIFDLIEAYLNGVSVDRAVKKARCVVGFTKSAAINKPRTWGFHCEELNQFLVGDANVYSHSQLDNGARLMMSALSAAPKAKNVLDLACGNGVLGIHYQNLYPEAQLSFVDESYQAIACAEQNYRTCREESPAFICANGITNQSSEAFDLILLNPPFHQGHVVTDSIALQLFSEAAAQLNLNGELWVVGNRHLGYHQRLKKWFTQVTTVASNSKFVVLRCSKLKQ